MNSPRKINKAEIISTGDELIEGRGVDTNSAYIAGRLAALGIEVVGVTTVGDDSGHIARAWREALARADLVVSTGGLGPTIDDLTSETLAHVAGRGLVLDEDQASRIREIFTRLGRSMPDNNLKQARLPQGAEVIENPLGTAPGYRLDLPQGVAVVLPGVPREMRPMLDDGLIPWLASRCGGEGSRVARSFQIFGMSESALDAALAGLTEAEGEGLAFRAGVPNISVRLSVTGGEQEAAERLDQLAAELKSRLGAAVYAEGETDMETVVGELARSKGVTLATAESCTGGLIGQRVTAVAGSSDYYMGGLVAYSDDVKKKVLGVEGSTLAMFGAVSEETATEMALGVRRLTGSDVGLAVTGIAGPTGGSEEKPVGTVVVALAADGLDDGAVSRSYRLWGDREGVRLLASQVALDWVRRHLLGLKADQSALGLRGRGRA